MSGRGRRAADGAAGSRAACQRASRGFSCPPLLFRLGLHVHSSHLFTEHLLSAKPCSEGQPHIWEQNRPHLSLHRPHIADLKHRSR